MWCLLGPVNQQKTIHSPACNSCSVGSTCVTVYFLHLQIRRATCTLLVQNHPVLLLHLSPPCSKSKHSTTAGRPTLLPKMWVVDFLTIMSYFSVPQPPPGGRDRLLQNAHNNRHNPKKLTHSSQSTPTSPTVTIVQGSDPADRTFLAMDRPSCTTELSRVLRKNRNGKWGYSGRQ